MIKLGVLNIDTSHPVEFAKIMQESGRAAYAALYDGGVRSEQYVSDFMKKNNIVQRYTSIEKMVDNVDAAFIHSCNWDKHLAFAEPFIRKGKSVFIDKPIVGNYRDYCRIKKLAEQGAVICGGSAFRYCTELTEFAGQDEKERGSILSLFGNVGVDEFNYGIHVIEAFGAIIPKGAKRVRCLSRENDAVKIYQIEYLNDVQGIFQLCSGIWRPTTVVLSTTKKTVTITPDVTKLYSALLGHIFDCFEGKKKHTDFAELGESILIALAAKKSSKNGNCWVSLNELKEFDPSFDGNTFEQEYAKLVNNT